MNTEAPSTATVERPDDRAVPPPERRMILFLALVVMSVVGIIFANSNPKPASHFDYQFRVALALLDGKLGLDQPVSWLNEFVPFEGKYYSVFPLGSVLSMVPAAVLQRLRGVTEFPAREVIAWCAGMSAFFLLLIAGRYGDRGSRRYLLLIWAIFGSWYWANTAYGGAWHLALALAFLGQAGALAFTLVYRRPFLAGLCFAVAFGNRTEVLLTAPVFLYLLLRHDPWRDSAPPESLVVNIRNRWQDAAWFCVVPFLLGVSTLGYNAARFHSPLQFGYSLIPGLLQNEYWYKYGFNSWRCIHYNAQAMFFISSWQVHIDPPFFTPEKFGGSILSASPFVVLAVRERHRDRALRRAAWVAIGIILLTISFHGNAGGVQFSYRYAITIIPWLFVLFLDQGGEQLSALETVLLLLSVLANGWAVYMFYWSESMGI